MRFRKFGESGVELELLAWIANPAQRGLVIHDLNCAVYRAFMREQITIPFPQRDLRILDLRSGQDSGRD